MQLPPPVHGVSVMSEVIRNSNLIQSHVTCYYLNSALASGISNLQKMGMGKTIRGLRIVLQLLWLLLRRRYEGVYLTFFPYGAGFVKDVCLILLCKLFGYSPWLHLHTLGFSQHAKSSPVKTKLYRWAFRHTKPICLSNGLSKDIEGLFVGSVQILPNGISPVLKETKFQDNQTLQVLFLSNLIKGKGILLVMEAMHLLNKKNVQAHLRVVGEEFDVRYAELKQLAAEYHISDRVLLMGPKYGHEKTELLQTADVIVLPSDYDTFGLVLLEAMQAGKACIATAVGAMPEVLSEGCGIILPERSAEALANALSYLIEHPQERRNMGLRARERYLHNYTAAHFEKNLLDILLTGDRGNSVLLNSYT